MLQEEFPSVPSTYIKAQLAEKRTLYAAYEGIAEIEHPGSPSKRATPYQHLKNPRKPKMLRASLGDNAARLWPDGLIKELEAARKARRKIEGMFSSRELY